MNVRGELMTRTVSNQNLREELMTRSFVTGRVSNKNLREQSATRRVSNFQTGISRAKLRRLLVANVTRLLDSVSLSSLEQTTHSKRLKATLH
ncbi:hypothetical protein DPMN_002261 [Dreissena polymorpha]|uniref:Uncharacterized protein n=1 Tax=Dreissena polymorpha TaxID=45954 RepID=A0A9D4RTT6_DREPO|nr:hypothetical protein DPMN_002261 [Dreissena polymorpha]